MTTRLRIWLARHCLECGQRKPKFTAICDECAERFGIEHAFRFYR